MKIEELKYYENKKIKILLKTGFVYTGLIEEFLSDSIRLRDKFNKVVTLTVDNINSITEFGGGCNGK